LRDFYVDEFGIAWAQAAQSMAYGTGIMWVIEPLLALMISRPTAIPAGIPAGDPPIASGSKGDAVRHYALLSSRLVAFVQTPHTGPSQSSASNPIGDKPGNGVAFTRPMCPYSQRAQYRGSGATTDAASFVCVDDESDSNGPIIADFGRRETILGYAALLFQ